MSEPTPDDRREHTRLLRAAATVPAIEDTTWRALLRGYLDGEPHVVRVLGDWCAEREVPALRPSDLDQRVRYVIGVLPPAIGHEIACTFVEHALEETGEAPEHMREEINSITPALFDALVVKRRWLAAEIGDRALKEVRRQITSLPIGSRSAFADVLSLTARAAAAQALASSPSPSVPQRASHLAASLLQGQRYHDAHSGFRRETCWQLGHLRAYLGA